MEDMQLEMEVENCSACGEAMDISTLPPYTNVCCPSCGEHSHVKCQIGPYKIIHRQGLGGMSLVFAARDSTLGRKVAIKLLNEDYSRDAKRIKEFEKEAKITALISHPNVVRVYTVGQAFNRYYIAMELVEGDSLEQLMQKQGKLCEKMITRLAIEIVEGLKAAHNEGLIHRDMKPGNVLIDSKGRAKIVDFGLALMTSGGKAMADEIWATPYYVPPETLELREEDLRSDIYALGASLYHALSGASPFTTETRSTTELLKIKTTIPKLGKVTTEVSPFLAEVIDKAMAFDADDRFQSYDAFLLALRQVEMYFRTGNEPEYLSEPTKARRDERQTKSSHWIVIAVVLVAAMVIGIVLMTTKDAPKSAKPSGAVAPDLVAAPEEVDEEAMRVLIAAELRNAQTFLSQGKYMSAHERYLTLAKTKGIDSETMYWSGMRSAISAWLGGESKGARTALREVLKVKAEEGGTLSDIDKKLQQAMARLLQLNPIQLDQISQEANDLDVMILFASALKEWDQGRWKNAEILFLALKLSETDSDQAGLEYYKKMSDAYLADFKLLSPYLDGFGPKSVEEAKENLTTVLTARNDLKTKGRALFNTLQWQRQINAKIEYIETERDRDVVDKKQQHEKSVKQWTEAKQNTLTALKKHDFMRVVNELEKVKALSEEDEKWRSSILYLTRNIENLYKATYAVFDGKSAEFVVRRLDGMVEYEKLLGAKPEGLLVGVGNKKTLLRWKDLSPYSMVDLHMKIWAQLANDEKIIRREQLIAYAWLTGLESKARVGAESLAEKNPEFSKRWKACMESVN